jgi:uncharacterized protein (DUF58 family)
MKTKNRSVKSASSASPVRIDLPRLLALRAFSGAGLLAPRHPSAIRTGGYRSTFRGRGMEFAEVRAYLPGDEVRNIDWRVTARRGEVHTKLFHEERERPVLFVLDYRRPMFFATRGRFKAVLASEFAAIWAWNAQSRGDRVGGFFFSETQQCELRPVGGQRGVLRLLQQMVADPAWQRPLHAPFEPQQRLVLTMRKLRRVVKPGTLVFLLSDFAQWDQAVEKELALLSRHSELSLCFCFDPLEAELPAAGSYRLSDGQRDLCIATGEPTSCEEYRARFAAHRQQLEDFCLLHRARFVTFSTEQDLQDSAFFKRRPHAGR